MGRRKGTEKTGGRQRGTPNKVTTDLREFVNSLLDDNRAQILDDLQSVEPEVRLRMFEKLLAFALPKMKHTDLQINTDNLSDEAVMRISDELLKNMNDEERD